MSIVVRPARLADIPRMQEIEDDAGKLFEGWSLIDYDDLAHVDMSDHVDAIDAQLSFVAELDGGTAGFVMGVMHGRNAYLHELDVAMDSQRKGMGATLVQAFIEAVRAKQASAVYLSTFRDPAWNAPFYARLGFREVARGDYLPWMTAIEAQQALFLDIKTRVFMRLKV